MSAPDSYDLLQQPWLLARDRRGGVAELSLLEVLRGAHHLAGLVGDVPTQVFALTRLLLAVLHRGLGGSPGIDEWAAMWRERELPLPRIERYLDQHWDRFDLFHPTTPFFQVAGLRTARNEVSELNRLIADVPNGRPFFSARLDRNISLSPAEAARWLVHCHAYDPSGIKSGAVDDQERVKNGKGYPIGTGWCGYLGGVLPEGATLLETLLLNLVMPTTADDVPPWERKPDGSRDNNRKPTGPVNLFTWQSRRIRLAHDGQRVTGVLICNGDRITPNNLHDVETHTAWRRSQNQERKRSSGTPVYLPLEHAPERLVWRGLQAMLPTIPAGPSKDAPARITPPVLQWISRLTRERLIPRDYPLRLRTIGMVYGSKNSTTAEILDDAVSLQAVLLDQGAEQLTQTALSCVRDAENAAQAVGNLAADLAEAAGSRDSAGHRARATELAYAELDPRFRAWLAALGPGGDPTDSKIRWHTTALTALTGLGDRLVTESPPSGWAGRMDGKVWISTSRAAIAFRDGLWDALRLAEQWDPARRQETALKGTS